MKNVFFLFSFFVSCAACAAQETIRFVGGEGWSEAGRRVKATMQSDAFRSLAEGRYKIEFADEEGETELKNLPSLRFPFVLVISPKGDLVAVADGLKADDSPEGIFAKIDAAVARREADEKAKAGASDPVAWARSKTMPFTGHDGKDRTCKNADGLEIIEEATWYRKNGAIKAGEEFVAAQKAMSAEYLTVLQKQSLELAEAALYLDENFKVDDPSKRGRVKELLEKTRDMDRNSLWGVAAAGLLDRLEGR